MPCATNQLVTHLGGAGLNLDDEKCNHANVDTHIFERVKPVCNQCNVNDTMIPLSSSQVVPITGGSDKIVPMMRGAASMNLLP